MVRAVEGISLHAAELTVIKSAFLDLISELDHFIGLADPWSVQLFLNHVQTNLLEDELSINLQL